MVKKTDGTITRRKAVAMLGAGTVIGAVLPDDTSALPTMQGDEACKRRARAVRYTSSQTGRGGGARRVLFVDSCCSETRNNILAGAGGPPTVPQGKDHLRDVVDNLRLATTDASERLEEYCFMLWGLTEKQLQYLRTQAETEFKLAIAPELKPK